MNYIDIGKKYIDLIGLIPIAVVALCFMSKNDLNNHLKKKCVLLTMNLLIFILVYLLLMHFNVNKWISICTALVMWIILYLMLKKYICN